ncbi:GHMP kinase [candidate division KSB1 bacterium]|nr:MAG: GHMP kinase [candidate division KSB1 bacterium]
MVISQTPLRISLAGGGSDLAEFYKEGMGQVISTAIDKYIFVIVKERFDDKIILNYSSKEIVDDVSQIKHELIREAMIMTGIKSGVEISTLADIPSEGSGLGSSSSLVVGLLNAMYMYKGEQVTAERLAQEACDIEITRCGRPIGKQDQYIAAFGGLRVFSFHPDERVTSEHVELSARTHWQFGNNLMLFYTYRTRNSAEILTEQKSETKQKRKIVEAMLPLVTRIREALLAGRFDEVGYAMHEGWMLKRKMASRISDSEIDEVYDRALRAGALGGKIAGAGGGGFLLLYVPPMHQERVRSTLSNLYELTFLPERDGSKVIFNLRRYRVK